MTAARIALIVLLAAGTATDVHAQSGTADALIALARGDYDTAARILKPLAESNTSSDTAAQFLMATLYEAGRGVPMNALHACALYQRASLNDHSMFGAQAQTLHKAMFHAHRHEPEWFGTCQRLANIGFDHRFEPVTFNLGAGHSIAWDLSGATIAYQGKTQRVDMPMGGRETAFLPLVYTPLRSPQSSRHFIEVFLWYPAGRQGWALNWHLFEVVREQLVPIANDDALATRSARPPADDLPDPRTLVALRMTAAGEAEWAILVQGRERRGTIAPR
jgi:hypothetical protein